MRTKTLLLATALAVAGCNGNGQKNGSQARGAAKKHWASARANVMANLAREQYDNGNFDQARKTTDEALKMDPENAPLRVLSARVAIEQGNLELADKELILARRLDTKNADADYLSG